MYSAHEATNGSDITAREGLTDVVDASFLAAGSSQMLVLEPISGMTQASSVSPVALDSLLLKHGAVLLRGFALSTASEFGRAANHFFGNLFGEYGDLPRETAGETVYESTPYPPDQRILFHNESSHLPSWPLRIAFGCTIPAQSGGATPFVDSRRVMADLDRLVVEEIDKKGLRYVRNFTPGIEPSWQEFFHTTDRAQVEAACRASGNQFEWRPGGALRILHDAPGVLRHPKTHEAVFFNQVQLHHIACVDEETRSGLRALFDDEDLPRTVTFGDGTAIPEDVMEHITAVYDRIATRFTWELGDMLVLDNMLVAHGRDTYVPPRRIVVALGQMFDGNALDR